MAKPTFSEDEERQIEIALEVRRRHSKEIKEQRDAEERERNAAKFDPAKPETNRRKSDKDRRAPLTPKKEEKKRSSLFAA